LIVYDNNSSNGIQKEEKKSIKIVENNRKGKIVKNMEQLEENNKKLIDELKNKKKIIIKTFFI